MLANMLPMKVKRALVFARGYLPSALLYGREFRRTYRFLSRSQWWNKEQLAQFQLQQVRRLLKHAYDNVPYYKELFDKIGFTGLERLEEIQKIPYLTREIVQNELERLVSVRHKRKLVYRTTGGSTGIPLGFYWEKRVVDAREYAFVWNLWNWKGIGPRDRFVVLRGTVLPDGMITDHRTPHTLRISSYHLTDAHMPEIVLALEKFRPSVIQAYPSSLYILARWLAARKHKPDLKLKAILTSSENLYDFQETLFREVFDTQVFDLYGNSERTAMANRCEEDTLHVIPQYGFVELVNRNGRWCKDEGESGEIISTGFINYAMPFVRYRTADMATYSAKKCSCGRNYPVLKRIEGRLQEVIVTKENRLISMTAINMHSRVFDNVRQFQFFQDTRGEVIFNVVRKSRYTAADTEHIKHELGRKLGSDMKLEIRFVEQISRTASGKHRFLIQRLPLGFDS